MNRLIVKSVRKRFGKLKVLEEVSFTCSTGEVLAIFGRNGTGKSTLLRILFGVLKPDHADILVNNQPLTRNRSNEFFGFHHQQVFLPKNITVRNLVPLFYPDGDDQNKIFYDPYINRIEKQKIGDISIGEQRYLQFLLLINSSHPFLLLDEPFSMTGPQITEIIKEKIREKKDKKGFIITDHFYKDVLEIADRVKMMKNGVMISIAEKAELVTHGYLSSRMLNEIK
jgi:ABC-type multidrug transport system ATPase subunit